MRILVDMDEVITDFRRGAIELHGQSVEEVNRRTIETGNWDLLGPLGVTLDEFWDRIDRQGETFWTELRAHDWSRELMELVEEFSRRWFIATSPSYHPSSYSGKAIWLKQFFNDKRFNRFFPCCHKSELAHQSILIDDRELNCIEFEKAGGRAILFPSVGNRLYSLRDNPLPYVREQLRRETDYYCSFHREF